MSIAWMGIYIPSLRRGAPQSLIESENYEQNVRYCRKTTATHRGHRTSTPVDGVRRHGHKTRRLGTGIWRGSVRPLLAARKTDQEGQTFWNKSEDTGSRVEVVMACNVRFDRPDWLRDQCQINL